MVKIAPSILSADFSELGEEVRRVEKGGADLVHIDVMDGSFVPNITIGQVVLRSIRKITRLPFDVHLMIEHPERYVESFVESGADIITVHAEASLHLHRTIQHIKEFEVGAGIALNPSTPLTAVENVLDDIDLILIMTVNPGFGGQEFIKSMLPKISSAKEMVRDRKVEIEVDGGINPETAPLAVNAGADILVAGNAVFGYGSVEENIRRLRESIEN